MEFLSEFWITIELFEILIFRKFREKMECASICAFCACRVNYFDFILISLHAYMIHLYSLKIFPTILGIFGIWMKFLKTLIVSHSDLVQHIFFHALLRHKTGKYIDFIIVWPSAQIIDLYIGGRIYGTFSEFWTTRDFFSKKLFLRICREDGMSLY